MSNRILSVNTEDWLPPSNTVEALRAEIGTPSDESIATAVEDYFEENPLEAGDLEWGDDPTPTVVFENGLL